jgi:hypothetical protein
VSATRGWFTVRVSTHAQRDAVLAALFEAGAMGVQDTGATFITHVPSQQAADDLVCAALSVDAEARVKT